jgi:glycosyltransferase involved in cell wall biosynthesis
LTTRPPGGPIRLLAVNPTGLYSGAETVLLRCLSAASAGGMEVTCLSPAGPLQANLAAAGIAWRRLPDLKLPAGRPPLAAARLAGRVTAAAVVLRRAAGAADLVLVNGFFALPALRMAHVRPPTVWLVHDVVHRRSWTRILERVKCSVGLAVAVSEAVAEPLRSLGVPVVVQRNGTPWPVPAVERRPSPTVIGCAGLLTPWKGQDVLLEAFARLARPALRLELAGGQFPKDGPYTDALRRRAGQPDLAGRVSFLGHVPDPLTRLRTWTVLVSPSVEPEAAPLNVMEAMSIGLPVVATDHGGPREFLGGSGLLVPPGDPDALARALAELLDDADRWESCHRAGPDLVAEHLRLDDRQAALLDLLRSQVVPGGRTDP